MSLAEIKEEIAKLTWEEQARLRREAFRDPLDDPAYLAELDRRHEEMLRGENVVTKAELYARLRASGKLD